MKRIRVYVDTPYTPRFWTRAVMHYYKLLGTEVHLIPGQNKIRVYGHKDDAVISFHAYEEERKDDYFVWRGRYISELVSDISKAYFHIKEDKEEAYESKGVFEEQEE